MRVSRRTDEPDRGLTPEQVAGYLAKYATKSADDTGATDNAHHRRIRATTRTLATRAAAALRACGDSNGLCQLLGKWVHMLGFRGQGAGGVRKRGGGE